LQTWFVLCIRGLLSGLDAFDAGICVNQGFAVSAVVARSEHGAVFAGRPAADG
jgi:hypothetical protein